MNVGLSCGPEVEVANLLYAIPAPKLVPFKGVLSVGVHYNSPTIPATKEKHSLHLMELHRLLVLLPDRIGMLADDTANLAEEEIPNHG
jgi:hypothetical protein